MSKNQHKLQKQLDTYEKYWSCTHVYDLGRTFRVIQVNNHHTDDSVEQNAISLRGSDRRFSK